MKNIYSKCDESAWEVIFLLKENGHLDDPICMNIIHKYFLECCRRIWNLIPASGSRKGVKAAEKYCNGKISWKEASKMDWYSEASAFMYEMSDESDSEVSKYINQIEVIRDSVGDLLVPPQKVASADIKLLLMDAAYFANEALNYPYISGGTPNSRKQSMKNISKFLPLDLFKEIVPHNLSDKIK